VAKTQTKVFTGVRQVPMPDHAEIRQVAVPIEFASAAYVANDLIQVVKLPAGVRCIDWSLILPDVDTNGAPTLAFSLGVENVGGTDLGTEVWGTGLAAGQAGVPSRNVLAVSSQGDISVDRNIDLKITTAAATYAGADKIGYLVLSLIG